MTCRLPAGEASAAPRPTSRIRRKKVVLVPDRIVPDGLDLMELAAVNWVLSKVKCDILTGRPAGKVIDQALKEVVELSTSGDSLKDFCVRD